MTYSDRFGVRDLEEHALKRHQDALQDLGTGGGPSVEQPKARAAPLRPGGAIGEGERDLEGALDADRPRAWMRVLLGAVAEDLIRERDALRWVSTEERQEGTAVGAGRRVVATSLWAHPELQLDLVEHRSGLRLARVLQDVVARSGHHLVGHIARRRRPGQPLEDDLAQLRARALPLSGEKSSKSLGGGVGDLGQDGEDTLSRLLPVVVVQQGQQPQCDRGGVRRPVRVGSPPRHAPRPVLDQTKKQLLIGRERGQRGGHRAQNAGPGGAVRNQERRGMPRRRVEPRWRGDAPDPQQSNHEPEQPAVVGKQGIAMPVKKGRGARRAKERDNRVVAEMSR